MAPGTLGVWKLAQVTIPRRGVPPVIRRSRVVLLLVPRRIVTGTVKKTVGSPVMRISLVVLEGVPAAVAPTIRISRSVDDAGIA